MLTSCPSDAFKCTSLCVLVSRLGLCRCMHVGGDEHLGKDEGGE